jgi:hypothetical protein
MSRLSGLLPVGSRRDLMADRFSCFGKSDGVPDSSPARPEGIGEWSIDGRQSFELPITAAQTAEGLASTNLTRVLDNAASGVGGRPISRQLPPLPSRLNESGSKYQQSSPKKEFDAQLARSSVPDAKARAEAARGGWHSGATGGPSGLTATQSTPSARRVTSGRNSEKR